MKLKGFLLGKNRQNLQMGSTLVLSRLWRAPWIVGEGFQLLLFICITFCLLSQPLHPRAAKLNLTHACLSKIVLSGPLVHERHHKGTGPVAPSIPHPAPPMLP